MTLGVLRLAAEAKLPDLPLEFYLPEVCCSLLSHGSKDQLVGETDGKIGAAFGESHLVHGVLGVVGEVEGQDGLVEHQLGYLD